MFRRDISHRSPVTAAVFGCLLLAVCANPTTTTRWVKAGADDEAVSREIRDCNAQASAALANEQGVNEDIRATLGRNWQLGGTMPIEDEAMRGQAAGYAERVLESCMRAKGFTKEG